MNENPTAYADAFAARLTELEIPFMSSRREKYADTAFTLPVLNKYLPSIRYVFIDDDGETRYFIVLLRNLKQEKHAEMLLTLSVLNGIYKLTGLNLDEDGDIAITYDFRLYGDPKIAAEEGVRILYRLDNIIDAVTPTIMKQAFQTESLFSEYKESESKKEEHLNKDVSDPWLSDSEEADEQKKGMINENE